MRKVVIVLILVYVVFIALTIMFSESEFIANLNTEYATGFSYEKFTKIEDDMSKQQVLQILGEPFAVLSLEHECFIYSRHKSSIFRVPPIPFDFASRYISFRVCFDERGMYVGYVKYIFSMKADVGLATTLGMQRINWSAIPNY